MIDTLAPTSGASRSALPSRGLFVLAVIDLGWGALGLILNALLFALAAFALILFLAGPDGATPALDRNTWFWAWIAFELLLSPILNLCLVFCGLRILQRRASALRFARVWSIGICALAAVDAWLVWSSSTSIASVVGLAFVLATPAWALAHLVVFRRPAWRAQLVG